MLLISRKMRTRREILRLTALLGGAAVAGPALVRAGSALADTPLERVPGAEVAYETIDDIPEIFDNDFDDLTSKGFTVVLFYGSRPPADVVEKMDRAERMYALFANRFGPENVFRYDKQRVADEFGTNEGVADHTEELYSVRGTPTVVAFCDGEEVDRVEGCDPPREDLIDGAASYLAGKFRSTRAEKCIR